MVAPTDQLTAAIPGSNDNRVTFGSIVSFFCPQVVPLLTQQENAHSIGIVPLISADWLTTECLLSLHFFCRSRAGL